MKPAIKKELETEQYAILQKQLEIIAKQLHRQTAFEHVFLRGIVSGIGNVIGATILFGILLAGFVWMLTTLSTLPYIGEYVTPETLETMPLLNE